MKISDHEDICEEKNGLKDCLQMKKERFANIAKDYRCNNLQMVLVNVTMVDVHMVKVNIVVFNMVNFIMVDVNMVDLNIVDNKLNFNVGLFSCIFWFEAIFISKSAIFCRSLFTREKGPK